MSDTESSETKPTELPKSEALAILQLRSSVVYPYMPQQLTASRDHSIRAVEAAQADGDLIAIFAQRSAEAERPSGEDLHGVGTVAKIHKVWRMPDGSMRLIVQGMDRAWLEEIVYDEPFYARQGRGDARRRRRRLYGHAGDESDCLASVSGHR